MAKNVGTTDKIIRLVVGAILIALPYVSGLFIFQNMQITLGSVAVGIVLIVTALFNFCPLYRLLGMRTCRA